MKKENRPTTLLNEIESPLDDRVADGVIAVMLYIAVPLAVIILVFNAVGGPDFLLWLASKI